MTARRSALSLFTVPALAWALSGGAAAVLPARPALAAVTQDPPEKVMLMMLEATKNRDYDEFLTEGNDELRGGITKQMFDGVCGQVSARLQKGYKTKYLTKLRKDDGVTVHLWKIELSDGKDELLLTMAVKDKKVAGIFMN